MDKSDKKCAYGVGYSWNDAFSMFKKSLHENGYIFHKLYINPDGIEMLEYSDPQKNVFQKPLGKRIAGRDVWFSTSVKMLRVTLN